MMKIIVLRNDEIEAIKNGKVAVMYQTDGTELNIMSEECYEKIETDGDRK